MRNWTLLDNTDIPPGMQGWLDAHDSLTSRLQDVLGAPVRVRILKEIVGRPFPYEWKALRISPAAGGWIREVQLLHPRNGRALVQARSFVPLEGPRPHPWQPLMNLGRRPLGSWLFEQPDVSRSAFYVTRTTAAHWPWRSGRWARYAVWRRRGVPLILTEVFLFNELYAG